jgi:hypothetical protein
MNCLKFKDEIGSIPSLPNGKADLRHQGNDGMIGLVHVNVANSITSM